MTLVHVCVCVSCVLGGSGQKEVMSPLEPELQGCESADCPQSVSRVVAGCRVHVPVLLEHLHCASSSHRTMGWWISGFALKTSKRVRFSVYR